MIGLEKLQNDIQELPEEAQNLLEAFIEFLKERYPKSNLSEETTEKSPYQKFKESGFIGYVSVEANLSTTYKQVLSEKLSNKYDHR